MFAGVQLQLLVAGMLTRPLPSFRSKGALAKLMDAKDDHGDDDEEEGKENESKTMRVCKNGHIHNEAVTWQG